MVQDQFATASLATVWKLFPNSLTFTVRKHFQIKPNMIIYWIKDGFLDG